MSSKSHLLLAAFDAGVLEHLQPFMQRVGARHFVGESCFDGWPGPSSLKPCSYKALDGIFFWWINRFSVGAVTLDLGYGDKEFIVESTLFYSGIRDKFSPWEILAAAQSPNPQGHFCKDWVLSADFIQKTICELSNDIIAHWDLLSSPSAEIIDRCRVLRGKRMVFAHEEQRRIDRERACINASAAFHAGSLDEAIRLLQPFRDDKELPRSSSMLLSVAENRRNNHIRAK